MSKALRISKAMCMSVCLEAELKRVYPSAIPAAMEHKRSKANKLVEKWAK